VSVIDADPAEGFSGVDCLDFSPEELELLREAGLLRDAKGEPWEPRTLDDVDWVAWRLKSLDSEIEALRVQADRRISRLNRARDAFLARYGADCQRITEEHLPRTSGGKLKAKSLDLDRVRVSLRTVPGGPRIVDEGRLVDFIRTGYLSDQDVFGLLPALQATQKLTGQDALDALILSPETTAAKVLAKPLKAYVEALAPLADENGEAQPATLPGVEIVSPRESWHYE
jgi:hypothetical protein